MRHQLVERTAHGNRADVELFAQLILARQHVIVLPAFDQAHQIVYDLFLQYRHDLKTRMLTYLMLYYIK
ncbi:hypothetical protein SDC9_187702 [bioreactor metagenome]|uniref:Uncharacterized protein n=1 Tax=bioreactor metagenome TaxID=1076179 RepID=A0A645HNL7_9ZZZZ